MNKIHKKPDNESAGLALILVSQFFTVRHASVRILSAVE